MSMMIKKASGGGISLSMLLLSLLLLYPSCCKAQDENDGLKFTPTFSPNGNGTLIPSTPLPTKSPSEYNAKSKLNWLNGHPDCEIKSDVYCNRTGDEVKPNLFGSAGIFDTNTTQIEEEITQTMVGELGVSYRPLVQAQIDYWINTSTSPRGFSFTKHANFEVRALAMGVVINGISNIDTVHGTFDASLKLYFFNITEDPFSTISDAMDTIYRESSRTTAATDRTGASNSNSNPIYFRLHNEDQEGNAWNLNPTETEDGERVHPDGICTASVMSTMKPIVAEGFKFDEVLRLPRSRVSIKVIADAAGHLSHVDVVASFKTRPLNRKFYPFQIDLLDMFFEGGSSNLITEDQRIVKHLLCLHPSYTGFGNFVYGSDAKAGMETSDALTMVPYIYYDFREPWITADNDHFYYNETHQRADFGRGFDLRRMIGLRIIVEHPPGKGWFEVLPILFVSLTAIANFVSADAKTVGASSMVQALLGVNSLVTQNIEFIGQYTIMAQSLVLAYCITGIWIFAVVLMVIINKAKKYGSGNKWYAVYQQQIFNYLRMLAESLLLVYVPYLSAYSIDKGNGRQERLTWAWALCISAIIFMFIVRAVRDYQLIRKRKEDKEANSIQALVFSSKPLNQWSQDEVLNWVRIGSMNRESYFSEAKRLSVAEKLENACADGELLSVYGADIDKLVQLIGLPFGDAVKLSQEMSLLNNKTDDTEVPTPLSLYKGTFPD